MGENCFETEKGAEDEEAGGGEIADRNQSELEPNGTCNHNTKSITKLLKL